MQSRLLVSLVVGFAIGLSVLWFLQEGPGTKTREAVDTGTPASGASNGSGSESAEVGKESGEGGGRTQTAGPAEGPPLRPFEIEVVDAQNGAPLSRIAVHDVMKRERLGESDERGRLEVPRSDLRQLVFGGLRCFAKRCSEREQRSILEGKRTKLRAFVDRYSVSLRLTRERTGELEVPAGARMRVWIGRSDGAPEDARGFPTAQIGKGARIDPELRRAWQEHVLLVDSLPADFARWHFGTQLVPFEFSGKVAEIKIGSTGSYRVRAVLAGKYVADQVVQITQRPVTELALRFQKARTIALRVVGPERKAVVGARVRIASLVDRRMPVREERTDGEGRVRFEGLFPGERVKAEFESDTHAYLSRAIEARSGEETVVLAARPSVLARLVIVEKGSGKRVAGASCILGNPEQARDAIRSDARGIVTLRLFLGDPRAISVKHPEFLPYRELLEARKGERLPDRIELVPRALDRQIRAGLLAVVEGVVSDAVGRPLVGQDVMLIVGKRHFLPRGQALPRLITEGGQAPSVLHARTDAKGRFLLASADEGKGQVLVRGSPGGQSAVILRLGQRVERKLVGVAR